MLDTLTEVKVNSTMKLFIFENNGIQQPVHAANAEAARVKLQKKLMMGQTKNWKLIN